jgi:hypothetical protein
MVLRKRASAIENSTAPVRMIDSIVIWLMICESAPNQVLSSLGLKRAQLEIAAGRYRRTRRLRAPQRPWSRAISTARPGPSRSAA